MVAWYVAVLSSRSLVLEDRISMFDRLDPIEPAEPNGQLGLVDRGQDEVVEPVLGGEVGGQRAIDNEEHRDAVFVAELPADRDREAGILREFDDSGRPAALRFAPRRVGDIRDRHRAVPDREERGGQGGGRRGGEDRNVHHSTGRYSSSSKRETCCS